MSGLDTTIHQPVRLRVMAALAAVGPEDRLEFTFLRDQLELTDGNLGAHLLKLEEAGYIHVAKVFERRKPKTLVKMTGAGRDAFTAHVQALQDILGTDSPPANDPQPDNPDST